MAVGEFGGGHFGGGGHKGAGSAAVILMAATSATPDTFSAVDWARRITVTTTGAGHLMTTVSAGVTTATEAGGPRSYVTARRR